MSHNQLAKHPEVTGGGIRWTVGGNADGDRGMRSAARTPPRTAQPGRARLCGDCPQWPINPTWEHATFLTPVMRQRSCCWSIGTDRVGGPLGGEAAGTPTG
jgi:hypothetical protein